MNEYKEMITEETVVAEIPAENTGEIQPKEKKEKTISIIEYVENEMATFAEKPFGVVDSTVLSQMTYMNLKNIVPGIGDKKPVTIAQLYRAEMFGEYFEDILFPKQNRQLLNAACASPRFRDIKINYYIESTDEEAEKQFAAMTFFLPTGEIYVAYRGTDTTINGWKEDFNMFFLDTIPGQLSAARYLKWVSAHTEQKMYVGGHSKGGNLAMYSASFVNSEIQDRIIAVFNHDGPGLTKGAMAKPEFSDMTAKMNITLPRSSIIGLIFCHGNYTVVESKRIGIMQHDLFSWELTGDSFVYNKEVKPGGNKIVDSVYDLMETLSGEDRELFIDTVFEIINSAGASNFSEFPSMALKSRDKILRTMKNLDPATAEVMKTVITDFIKVSTRKAFRLPENEATEKINEAISKLSATKDRISVKISQQTAKSIEATEKLGAKINETVNKVSETVAKVGETTEKLGEKLTETVNRFGDGGRTINDLLANTVGKAKDIILRSDATESAEEITDDTTVTKL